MDGAMRILTDIKLLIYRRTRIVATLGPASRDSETIERLIDAGVNVFRINMSHGDHNGHRKTYEHVREAAGKMGKPVAVLADLSGPKIRVGSFDGGFIELKEGSEVTVTTRDVKGEPGLIPSQYKALANDVEMGNRILLDDGNLELRVQSIEGSDIRCLVIAGGVLSDHKGMNLPGVRVSAPSLTEKDRADARFALGLGVDFLALSFVRQGSDVEDLQDVVRESGTNVSIVAKIEKPEALENIDEIVKASDGIMIARGDLGVELPPQAVPAAQDQLIDLARVNRKPVIVATQMLESMMDRPRPTRAEVSDVANAVRIGADAIMLSGETAVGKYPVQAVRMMDMIARQTEGYLWRQGAFVSLARKSDADRPIPVEDAISESMAQLSRDLLVRAIIVLSLTGRSMAVMSSSRPAAPIVGISPEEQASRAACLLWGVIPVAVDPAAMEDSQALARKTAVELGLVEEGQSILVVKGFSSDRKMNTPSVTVLTV
jgi:pyruvate kinase